MILSDGVSLRNFVYSGFYKKGVELGYEITFLNTTKFELKVLGLSELRIDRPRIHFVNTILKNVRKRVEIKCFQKRYNNKIYTKYLFPLPFKGLKNIIRSYAVLILSWLFNSESGIKIVRNWINYFECKTDYFKQCHKVINQYKPEVVYNTSQRSILAIAPIQAAKKLNMPTIGFVYSWDNLPKATLDVETDQYHVWSQHMKAELLQYHPFIKQQQVTVTGTPQFEPHYYIKDIPSLNEFIDSYGLNPNKAYICFSGDDITTSPKDPLYLRDLAKAVENLNTNGYEIGIIFRRCPVDLSERYDEVLKDYEDIISVINPIWKPLGKVWDTILPTKEDAILLASISKHCKLVVNLGSSMVFDFVIHNNPCAYVNYNYLNSENKESKGVYVYDYIHFKSMPSSKCVYWVDASSDFESVILEALKTPEERIKEAVNWFGIINQSPAKESSKRIWEAIDRITQ